MSAAPDVPASVPVVIVGGGPTGIAAATLLAQHGVESVILDRWAEIYPQPRAVAADDEVCRILARMGIGAEFAELSRPGLGLRLVDPNLKVLSEFRRQPTAGKNGFPESNMFDQPELEKALRANLQNHPEAHLRGNAEVTAMTQLDTGRLRVSVSDRESGDEFEIESDFVFGCDGANSLVRRTIGATLTDLRFEQRWLVIDIDTDADLDQWDGVHQVCSCERAGTYMRVGNTRYRWEFQLLPDETSENFTTLSAIAPLIAPWVDAEIVETMTLIRTCEYTFRARVAERWRRGNVFLLGDAAHLTPPFIGQGMGAGLRDAMNLSWKVAGVYHGTLPDSVLDSYQRERKAHARSMIRFAVVIGWAMTAGGRAGDRIRRYVLPRLQPLAGLAGAPQTPALRSSSLVHPSRRTGDLAGTLCPNPVLETGRFDEVIGNRVAVVTRSRLPRQRLDRLAAAGVMVLEVADDSELGAWLQRGHAYAVVVRPDRTVMCTTSHATGVDELCSAAMPIAEPVTEKIS
ncbi:bifunctional 3-(3-hydroxy-phenyl)propionate/3-hydroxycinnamic acid hydroxylase [soil metagenome]